MPSLLESTAAGPGLGQEDHVSIVVGDMGKVIELW